MIINYIFLIIVLSITAVLFLDTKFKGIVAVSAVIVISIISGFIAIRALDGKSFEVILQGPATFGHVPVRVDSLSAWFILVINFTFTTGALYGLDYMKHYKARRNELSLHWIAFILIHFALLGICSVQNGFIFLLLWEVMALSVFIIVIFEHEKPDVIKAGLNYLVQSHISIVFLMLGFIYFSFRAGSTSFDAIAKFSHSQSSLAGTALFICFFTGFAIKSGFVPFHTWLPYAHPAAPSHVSGIMSGVVIKIGIYGIMRMLLLIKTDYTIIGYFILVISLLSGIYGVMLATIQHNLKKLLAYHSIENIGIIGMGIGIGCIGLGTTNKWMAILGFSGALLHTLNHSLFKSVLFYSAGNVLQAARTVNIEKLGGLIKKMPETAILFLIAALAICGLPPLNGFISEFLIYAGLYNWMYNASVFPQIAIVFALIGLVLIGGLAILCFTKAFSIVFLGTSRSEIRSDIHENSGSRLFPMYMAITLMVIIGLFPSFFIKIIQTPVRLFTDDIVFNLNLIRVGALDSLKTINWLFLVFIVLVVMIAGLKRYASRNKTTEEAPTWGCGYTAADSKIQYTASSYVKSYARLAKPLLDIEKKDVEISGVFPADGKHYKTDSYDKIERLFIDKPLKLINRINEFFLFLQNGHLQRYILYGIIFITAIICLPLLIEKLSMILHLLKTL